MFRMSRRRVYEIVNHVTATPSTPDRLEPIDVAVLRRHASTVRSLWPDDAWTSASLGRWNGNPDDLPPPPKRSATKIDAIA